MNSRQMLFGKLNLSCFRAIESATALAQLRGHSYVELAHWIYQFLQFDDGDLQRICGYFKIDVEVVKNDLRHAVSLLPSRSETLQDFSRHVVDSIEKAWLLATLEMNQRSVRGAWLIIAIIQNIELRQALMDISPTLSYIPAQALCSSIAEIVAGSPEEVEEAHEGISVRSAMLSDRNSTPRHARNVGRSTIDGYCVDLTERAHTGRIDPVIGRTTELQALIGILMRRRQNNPLLIGEPGVGKTAMVQRLACAIAEGGVPPALADVRLLVLETDALSAGACTYGEIDERLRLVIEEANASARPCIFFLDGAHMRFCTDEWAGRSAAENWLETISARGTLRVIGAMTQTAYHRCVARDSIVAREFQVLQIREPEEAAAIEMVRIRGPVLARHHGVVVVDEAVRASVILSHRYLPDRRWPGKALSLLDAASARIAVSFHAPPESVLQLRRTVATLRMKLNLVESEDILACATETRKTRQAGLKSRLMDAGQRLEALESQWAQELTAVREVADLDIDGDSSSDVADREFTRPLPLDGNRVSEDSRDDASLMSAHVDESAVIAVVAEWTGIPAHRIAASDTDAISRLQITLEQHVLGQSRAISAIVERMRTTRAHLADPDKPASAFLLIGPPGVGKTETARALAKALHGNERHLIRYEMHDCSKAYSTAMFKRGLSCNVSDLRRGLLTEEVRRKPFSVILLDEVEKAHPDVIQTFRRVLEEGRMDDDAGHAVDFRNTTILFTTSAGADEIVEVYAAQEGSEPDDATLNTATRPALERMFPGAFLRQLSVVPFQPLVETAVFGIVDKQLERLVDRMRFRHDIELICTLNLVAHIVDECETEESGAHLLPGFIERNLLPPLSHCCFEALREQYTIERITADAVVDGTMKKSRITCRVDRKLHVRSDARTVEKWLPMNLTFSRGEGHLPAETDIDCQVEPIDGDLDNQIRCSDRTA